jgi:N-acetylglucosamine-6-sulfatase
MRYPKLIKPHSTDAHLVLNLDISPTLLELGGAPIPSSVQGHSLVPLLRHGKVPWRDALLVEYWSDTVFPRVSKMGYQAVRTDRWKYIHYLELDGMEELYDLKADQYETRNRFADSKAPSALSDLKTKLAELLRETK